jgi:hypothetical protein
MLIIPTPVTETPKLSTGDISRTRPVASLVKTLDFSELMLLRSMCVHLRIETRRLGSICNICV